MLSCVENLNPAISCISSFCRLLLLKKTRDVACHERHLSSWIMCIKGLVYRLSHDCHSDIDRDVSTAHYRSSLGNSGDLQIAPAKMQRRWLS